MPKFLFVYKTSIQNVDLMNHQLFIHKLVSSFHVYNFIPSVFTSHYTSDRLHRASSHIQELQHSGFYL